MQKLLMVAFRPGNECHHCLSVGLFLDDLGMFFLFRTCGRSRKSIRECVCKEVVPVGLLDRYRRGAGWVSCIFRFADFRKLPFFSRIFCRGSRNAMSDLHYVREVELNVVVLKMFSLILHNCMTASTSHMVWVTLSWSSAGYGRCETCCANTKQQALWLEPYVTRSRGVLSQHVNNQAMPI